LVRWTSYYSLETGKPTRVFRFRIIAYLVMLAIAFVALFYMGSKKEHMLLNINRTSQLYKITPDGKVKNTYVFLFQNTDTKKHTYYFEVVDNPDIKIARPKKPFDVVPGKKVKKVVILYTDKVLAKDTTKDTPIPIKIKAYAVDDPEKIVVYRDTIFVFPRWDIYQEHLKKEE
ncbi:MAG: cytochrome c oxidase accessory protein CcoG, partial [Epsilonproteobacteria bacterium]|nr:cytochrome c oxidase accessory protein CcoG [Campylobacterota bacterium]